MTLPHGFSVALDRNTRVLDGGRALLGGHPTRLLRLTPRARSLMSGRTLRVHNTAGAVLADRLLEGGMAHPVAHELPAPGAEFTCDCTYVIPVRDRPRQLARLLACLPPDSPVVVVDDASLDPAPVAALAARHDARLLALPTNVGPAAARNAGLREVITRHVVFVDSDVVLPPETVPTLLRHFADPAVVMVVPRITALATGISHDWLSRYEQARSSLDLGTRPAPVRPGTPVSWVPSACAVARTEAMRAAGGFDETMRIGEDVDLCWRLLAGGGRIRYEPAVHAAHEHRTRITQWFRRKAEYGTGAHPLAVRHPDSIHPAVFAPWSAAFLVAVAAQRRWSVPVAAAACGAAAVRIARVLNGTGRPVREATRLTAAGALDALCQGGALLTRHWWPAIAFGCLASGRIRRAAAVAALLDIALEYPRHTGSGLGPVRYGIARRLDDLAYGTGVWLSCAKGRSIIALRPRLETRGRRMSRGTTITTRQRGQQPGP